MPSPINHHAVGVAHFENLLFESRCGYFTQRLGRMGMTVNEALRFGVQAFASSTCGAASALPSEIQLPKHVRNWAPFFESKIL